MKLWQISVSLCSLLVASPVFAGNAYKNIVSDLVQNIEDPKATVAVLNFSYTDGRNSQDGLVISERLATQLVKSKKIAVVERKELDKVLQELKLAQTGLISANSTAAIGKMLGADFVLLGSLTEMPNNQLSLSARIVSTASGTVISAALTEVKKDWLDQYRKLLLDETKKIAKNPKDAGLLFKRGCTNLDLGRYDDAIADFSLAIDADGTSAESYLSRGRAYSRKNEYSKAIEDYSKALALNMGNAEIYFSRGSAYQGNHDSDKAIEDYSKAIALKPDFGEAYYNRGVAYKEIGQIENAQMDFSKYDSLGYKIPKWEDTSPL